MSGFKKEVVFFLLARYNMADGVKSDSKRLKTNIMFSEND